MVAIVLTEGVFAKRTSKAALIPTRKSESTCFDKEDQHLDRIFWTSYDTTHKLGPSLPTRDNLLVDSDEVPHAKWDEDQED